MRKTLVLGFILFTTNAFGQTVINPRLVEFTPSLDHDIMLSDGTPKVDHYEIQWFASGASAPVSSGDLKKPAPANGIISVDIRTLLIGIPFGNNYTAKVAAIGPTGSGVSNPSNPFDFVSPPAPATNVTLKR